MTLMSAPTESSGSTPKTTPSRRKKQQAAGLKALIRELERRYRDGEPITSRLELAEKMKITRQAIYAWTKVPVENNRCLEIERLLGIPRHVLRPDVYPEPPAKRTPSRGRSSTLPRE